MLNVKVTRLQPVVSQNANKLRAIADIEIGNGLMIYGLLYKLNKGKSADPQSHKRQDTS